MKTKVLITLGMIIMLVAGFFIGKYQENRIWSRYADHYLYWWPATHEANNTVQILTCLQNGHQEDAINILNTRLDISLFNINNFTNFPEDFGIKAIQNARAYRLKYPWVGSNPDVNKIVNAILFPENRK